MAGEECKGSKIVSREVIGAYGLVVRNANSDDSIGANDVTDGNEGLPGQKYWECPVSTAETSVNQMERRDMKQIGTYVILNLSFSPHVDCVRNMAC